MPKPPIIPELVPEHPRPTPHSTLADHCRRISKIQTPRKYKAQVANLKRARMARWNKQLPPKP